jgi:hypothetical protein
MAKPVVDMKGTFMDIIKVLIEKRTIKPSQVTKIYEKRNPGKPAKTAAKIMVELKKHIGYDDCFITQGERRGTYYEVPRGFETWKFEVALRTLPNNADPEQKTKPLPPVDNFVDKFEDPVEETQKETEKIQKPVKVTEKDKKATIVFLHKAKNLICDSGTTALTDRALFLATKKPESNLDLDKHLFIIRTIGKKEGVNILYEKNNGCIIENLVRDEVEDIIENILQNISTETIDGQRWKQQAETFIKYFNPLTLEDCKPREITALPKPTTVAVEETVETVEEKEAPRVEEINILPQPAKEVEVRIQREFLCFAKEDYAKVINALADENSIEGMMEKTGLPENVIIAIMQCLVSESILDETYHNLASENEVAFEKLVELQNKFKVEKKIRKRNMTVITRMSTRIIEKYISSEMKKSITQLGQLNNGLYIYNIVINIEDEQDLAAIDRLLLKQECDCGETITIPVELQEMFKDQKNYFFDFFKEREVAMM